MRLFIILFLLCGSVFAQSRFDEMTVDTISAEVTIDTITSEVVVNNKNAATEAVKIVDFHTDRIFESDSYFIHGWSEVANGDSLMFVAITPNTTKWVHMLFDVTSTGILTTKTFESATASDCTAVASYNNNRNSGNTAGLITGTVTTSDVSVWGTCIDSSKVGSGNKTGGTMDRSEEDMVLKQNTTYIYLFISGTAANVVSYRANWYEYTHAN